MSDATLGGRLAALDIPSESAEEDHFRLLLGMAAGELARSDLPIERFESSVPFATILAAISSRWSGRIRFQGPLSFIEPTTLQRLQTWCKQSRENGARVDQFAMSHLCEDAANFVQSNRARFCALLGADRDQFFLNRAMFVHYEKVGDRSDPHLDEIDHEVNAVVCVSHQFPHRGSSSLRIFCQHPRPKIIRLRPGEAVVFDGAYLLHGREPLAESETVELLTIGFKRITNG